MPRTRKNPLPETKLLSDSIDLNAIPDMNALGDLAAPIQFPEEAQADNKKRRGRPKKKAEAETNENTVGKSNDAQSVAPAFENAAPLVTENEKVNAKGLNNLSENPESKSIENQTAEPAADNVSTDIKVTDAKATDGAESENATGDQSTEEAVDANAARNGNRYPPRNQRYNNRFNNKFNRGNRRFMQEEIPEEPQTPPPSPEQIAEAVQKWKELRNLPMFELHKKAQELEIQDFRRLRKQALIYKILAVTSGEDVPIYTEGVLEILNDGYGFLRNPEHNYLAGPDDIYIHQYLIKRFDLKTGDTITGQVRKPRDNEKYFSLMRIDTINGDSDLYRAKRRVAFEYLTPIHPFEQLNLEWKKDEYSTRIMNLFMPIGKGQRSIILAPPRTGKTVLLQNIATAITENHPDVTLLVLLIDERPEEVTEMRRTVKGEVLASTFDEPPERHVQVADMVLEKAKRLVEYGKDVVILLDSITRFARANNVVIPHSGKILSGGVDAMAMQRPKRFFGAARKIENGGSLTIIGTSLIETGSRMDEVIFEEFKGTGNMEVVLDRRIAEKRIWPAIDIFKSGTRKEELLLDENTLTRVYILRRYLQEHTSAEIIEFLRDKMKMVPTNQEFLQIMNR